MVTGKFINLALLTENDIEEVREWRNSKEVAEHMLSRIIISKEQQQNWYQKIKDDDSGIYWIILSKQGEKLGLASLTKINTNAKEAEPGLYIASEKHRSSFSGMEAYYLLLNHGFTVLQLDKVFGTVLSSNKTAVKMNNSFGYTTEKTLRNELNIDGVLYDVDKVVLYKADFYKSPMARFFKK